MRQDNQTATHRSRKRSSNIPFIIVGALALLFSVFFYFWVQGDSLKNTLGLSGKQEVSTLDSESASGDKLQGNGKTTELRDQQDSRGNNSGTSSLDSGPSGTTSNLPDGSPQDFQSGKLQYFEDGSGIAASTNSDTGLSASGTETPEQDQNLILVKKLNDFYAHLDQQDYMKSFALPQPSKIYFSNLIQKLLDNPPVVTRETDDLFTLLKNTAHFFRVLGKKNILVLKGILDREKDSFEEILQSFYQLTYHPEYLQNQYGISIPEGSLHDYAGFFLNTMGGRLYLFRRDSLSRLAVSYYSILVVDQAISNGNGRHGIDLRPAIDSLIDELENGGDRLKLKNTYLEKLYDLQQKYQR